MQTADFNVEDFETREAGDKSVFVKFYTRPKLNEPKSDEAGRPIYDEVDYLEIRTPGNQTNIIQRPVTDMDKKRFGPAYRRFKESGEEVTNGTPLVEAPWITRSQVEELHYLHIRSVEHLANVGDDVCTRIPGLFKLKQRAQHLMENAEKSAPFTAMQAKNEELENKLAALAKTVDEQAALIKQLSKPAAK